MLAASAATQILVAAVAFFRSLPFPPPAVIPAPATGPTSETAPAPELAPPSETASAPTLEKSPESLPATTPVSLAADPTYLGELTRAAHDRRLAESRLWQVLLHYRRTTFGGWRSEADGLDFFLASKRGRRDPSAELQASLAAFLAPSPAGDGHAQCRFPARWAWLKDELAIDPRRAPDRPCPDLAVWSTGISAQAVTLVYATAYINSPASMYGHTFLRLSRATGEGNPLLDYVVNFAADVDTDNGIIYAIKGVSGGFAGRFYVMPYYVKVQEYSNMESRDLWEYELSLSPAEARRLVLHAWETRTTHFDYYFFTRNCSYHLLALLEAARPELHLVDRFPGAVIPSDTVRVVLEQPGLIGRKGARPSLLSIMQQRKRLLAGDEVRAAETWAIASPDGPPPKMDGSAPKPRQALVVDAAYDYLRYREGLHAEPSDAFKRRERQILLARGRLGVPPQEVVTRPSVDAPERGHGSLRVGLGGGYAGQSGPFQTLAVRGAIHDYLDPPRGYPVDARLEMGDLRLRFDDRRRALGLDRLDLIDIVSAAPFDRWVQGASWKVWIGADNARELGCQRPGSGHEGWRCLYGGVITGGGAAVRFGPRRSFLLLGLAETDVGAGPAFSDGHDYRVGAGGEILLTGGAGQRWRFELGVRYAYYFLGERPQNLRTRAAQALSLTDRFALRASVETAGSYGQAAGELIAYF
jgi:hypothetical protein